MLLLPHVCQQGGKREEAELPFAARFWYRDTLGNYPILGKSWRNRSKATCINSVLYTSLPQIQKNYEYSRQRVSSRTPHVLASTQRGPRSSDHTTSLHAPPLHMGWPSPRFTFLPTQGAVYGDVYLKIRAVPHRTHRRAAPSAGQFGVTHGTQNLGPFQVSLPVGSVV